MSDQISEIEARLEALPSGPDHARERIDLINELGWEIRDLGDHKRVFALCAEAMDLSQRISLQEGFERCAP